MLPEVTLSPSCWPVKDTLDETAMYSTVSGTSSLDENCAGEGCADVNVCVDVDAEAGFADVCVGKASTKERNNRRMCLRFLSALPFVPLSVSAINLNALAQDNKGKLLNLVPAPPKTR